MGLIFSISRRLSKFIVFNASASRSRAYNPRLFPSSLGPKKGAPYRIVLGQGVESRNSVLYAVTQTKVDSVGCIYTSTSSVTVATVRNADKTRMSAVFCTMHICRKCALSRGWSWEMADAYLSTTGGTRTSQSCRIYSGRRCCSPLSTMLIFVARLAACCTCGFHRSS